MSNSVIESVRKHWFLVGLIVLLPTGLLLARSAAGDALSVVVDQVPTSVCTGLILFLMAITLDSQRLLASLRRPLPVLSATLVNQAILPLMCLPLVPLVESMDLKLGLLIAASVPCTMAAASVWTRRAEGNDAVSLLVTLITNGMCFLVTPAWLSIGARWFGLADTSDAFTFGDMVLRLTLAALLPAVLGQILRINISVRFVIDKNKRRISTVAQIIILSLVFISAFRGGRKFDGIAGSLNHAEMALTWGLCIGLHLAAMLAAWLLSTLLKFNEEDRRATLFAGSQKTLPIGILVSQASGLPLSIIPMLMFHASQLFIDTWIADRLKLGRSGVTTSETAGGEAADGQTPAQDTRSGA